MLAASVVLHKYILLVVVIWSSNKLSVLPNKRTTARASHCAINWASVQSWDSLAIMMQMMRHWVGNEIDDWRRNWREKN